MTEGEEGGGYNKGPISLAIAGSCAGAARRTRVQNGLLEETQHKLEEMVNNVKTIRKRFLGSRLPPILISIVRIKTLGLLGFWAG